jgi:hypothetical protein
MDTLVGRSTRDLKIHRASAGENLSKVLDAIFEVTDFAVGRVGEDGAIALVPPSGREQISGNAALRPVLCM